MAAVLKVEVRFWGCCWDGQRVFMHSKVKIKTKADWMKLPKFLENGWLSPFDVCLQWNGAQHPSPGVATQESTIPMAVVIFLYALPRRLTLVFLLLLLFFYSSSSHSLGCRKSICRGKDRRLLMLSPCVFFPSVAHITDTFTGRTMFPWWTSSIGYRIFWVEWLGVVGWVILIKLPMSSSPGSPWPAPIQDSPKRNIRKRRAAYYFRASGSKWNAA